MTIDGTTQPGYSRTPLIELDGAGAGADPNGLTITGNDITVKGLIVGGFSNYGIEVTGNDDLIESSYIGIDATGTQAMGNGEAGVAILDGGTGNTIGGTAAGAGNVISANAADGVDDIDANANVVAGNWIGTDAVGTAALANGGDGVYVDLSSSVLIGGTSMGSGNLISGNVANGVEIDDSRGTLVQGNLIGLDQTGTLAIGNRGAGVLIDDGSASSTIGGPVAGGRNFISGNAEGVQVTGSSTAGTEVAGNLIGTDVEGTAAVGNLTAGIVIAGGTGATIGGGAALAVNVISGNLGDGIDIAAAAANTVIQGNFIGTDQTGTKPLGNTGSGVSIDPSGVTIGGTAQGEGNVISANAQAGVSIAGTGTTGVAILGNRIGTDVTGKAALGNGTFGVIVDGTPDVTIGGTATGDRNIISANPTAGIGLYAGTTGALVENNLIGTDITGSLPFGNGNGIQIDGGSSSNTIGGTAAGAGNIIAFSTGIGVDVNATAGTGNAIRLNAIFSNTGLGIDLGGDGVTLNDSVPHAGPNDYQNFPVITAAASGGGVTAVTGTLDSTPDTTFAIDFYTLSSLNASGYGEGRYVLGSASVTTDATGNVSFTFQFPTPSRGGQFVTATATDPGGDTSEFSQAFGVELAPTAVIGFTNIQVNVGAAIPFSGLNSADPSGNPLTYTWSFGDGATATGPAPTHTYKAVKTDTVTLTVNDGFGGISTATATVTVVDVPPVFTPDAFAPPLTYTTPSPGDGFGEAVAANYGNVAIGAPSDHGTGAVYLYDGVTTANESISTYAYGSLIHVFADPNPEPGDEFGASLAVVGNDLVVGAPGSSLSGTGDGVVYVFDANAEGTTFGDLLATLTIPDAGALTNAHFGAAVGATNTDILVGAPGQEGGTGAAYVFEGDTTRSNFGALLLDIPNPTSQPGSDFGAAVAADGNDVIVGAPTVGLAGAVGGVFLFDGTTGDPITSIANSDASTTIGFGSAVASVGSNILIGSPDDNGGAGAAFLYAPPATAGTSTLLTTFVQPDGGGGNFGASVAGTEDTALVGAPGATLGVIDAGAAYLFDANPTSPTFGQAIGAVQEPTPTSGDALGTAVGFDDGALIAGAAAAGAVDLYQPTDTLSLSSETTYATASFDSVILSGTFMDANPSATLTASIDWGDGSPDTVIDLPVGSYAFAAPHQYTTDPASGSYTIGVTLTDPAGESAFAQTTLAISNPAPAFAAPGLILSSSSIVEGGTVSVSGTIVSPDGIDDDSVTLDWGDGSAPTTIVLAMGQDTFSTTHEYLNNPAGVESEDDTIVGSVTSPSGQVGYASASVTVNKVAPQFTAADLSLSETTANEGDTIALDGQFTDPDALSSYTVTIDWGDGSTPTVLSELAGQVLPSPTTPGLYTYSAPHAYPYPSAGLPGGSYAIQVSVSDGVNTASAGTSLVVNTVPVTIQITSSITPGKFTQINLMGQVTDLDPVATVTVDWTVTQTINGVASVIETSTSSLTGSGLATGPVISYEFPIGTYVATAIVTDSDGGMETDSAVLMVISQSNSTITIAPATGADQTVVLITGADDTVIDPSTDTTPVQLISTGSNVTLIGGAGNDLLVAGSGANSLVGGSGDDTLVSNGGDDTLVGGSGNTSFQINPGSDPLVIGGSGTNTLDFSTATQPITINLGLESGQTQVVDPSNDVVILEGKFSEYIASSNGDNVRLNDDNDLVYAAAGNTTITGGSGHDSIVGGSGNDIIYATTGNTTITGGSGHDCIVGGSGNDIIYATTGNTTITGGSGHDCIVGGSGNDIIYATTGNTTITGGSGHDSIVGGSGNDIIYATTGNTTITGGSGHDCIVGGSGNDIIYATTGNTTITGGSGHDSSWAARATTSSTPPPATPPSRAARDTTGSWAARATTSSTPPPAIPRSPAARDTTRSSGARATTSSIRPRATRPSRAARATTRSRAVRATTSSTPRPATRRSRAARATSRSSAVRATISSMPRPGTRRSPAGRAASRSSAARATTSSTAIPPPRSSSAVRAISRSTAARATCRSSVVRATTRSRAARATTRSRGVRATTRSTAVRATSSFSEVRATTRSRAARATTSSTAARVTTRSRVAAAATRSWAGRATTSSSAARRRTRLPAARATIRSPAARATIRSPVVTGNDIIYGGSGNDTITGGYGAESIVGGSGNDLLIAGNLSSTITGGSGNDLILGGYGNDIIFGGTGDTTIAAGTGNDSITGGSGDDLIFGGTGDSTISGGTGNATISGGGGDDVLRGGGFDSWLMFYGSTNMTLTNTTFSTSGGSLPASVSSISGFQDAILAAGPGDFTLDASGFSGERHPPGRDGQRHLDRLARTRHPGGRRGQRLAGGRRRGRYLRLQRQLERQPDRSSSPRAEPSPGSISRRPPPGSRSISASPGPRP